MSHLQALTRLSALHRHTHQEAATFAALRNALDRFTEGFDSPPLLDAIGALRSESPGGTTATDGTG